MGGGDVVCVGDGHPLGLSHKTAEEGGGRVAGDVALMAYSGVRMLPLSVPTATGKWVVKCTYSLAIWHPIVGSGKFNPGACSYSLFVGAGL